MVEDEVIHWVKSGGGRAKCPMSTIGLWQDSRIGVRRACGVALVSSLRKT